MSAKAAAAAFKAANDRRLRKAGLVGGHVWATLRDGALELGGEEGGALRIAAGEVARLRVGYFETKSARIYQASIWRGSEGRPLRLVPYPHSWAAYTQTIRGFAASIADNGGGDRIEGGSSKFDALFGPVLMAVPAFGALAVALFALASEPWWARLIVPAIPLALFALLLKIGITRYWPLPIRDLADLDGQLPPLGKATARNAIWHLLGGRRR